MKVKEGDVIWFDAKWPAEATKGAMVGTPSSVVVRSDGKVLFETFLLFEKTRTCCDGSIQVAGPLVPFFPRFSLRPEHIQKVIDGEATVEWRVGPHVFPAYVIERQCCK